MGLDDLKRGHPGARLVLRPAQRDGFEARFPPVRLVHVVHVPVVLFHDIAVVYSWIKLICKMVNKITIFQYIYIYIINILHVSRYLKKLGSSWLHFCFCWTPEIGSKSALCRWLGMCAAGKSAFLLGKGAGRAESHAPRHTLEKCWPVASRCFKAKEHHVCQNQRKLVNGCKWYLEDHECYSHGFKHVLL